MSGISIILPFYNAESFIYETINTILNQTFDNIELIIIDDHSSDNSYKICEGFSDKRIILLKNTNPQGVSNARNFGIEKAKYSIIALIDADDLWDSQKLEKQMAFMNENPDISISFCRIDFINPEGKKISGSSQYFKDPIQAQDLLYENPSSTCSTLLFKKEVFIKTRGFRTDLTHSEDLEWLLRAALEGYIIKGTPDISVHYRIYPGSLSFNTKKMLQGWESLLTTAKKYNSELFMKHKNPARASFYRYLSNRTAYFNRKESCYWLWQAIMTSPIFIFKHPLRLASSLLKIIRGYRHE